MECGCFLSETWFRPPLNSALGVTMAHEEGNRVMSQTEVPAARTVSRTARMYRSGGVSTLLLASLLSFVVVLPGLGLRNWLVVLFELNAGFGGLPADPLRFLNPLDVAILLLAGITFLGLWPALGKISRIWTSIAIALPFAGIAVLFVTQLAGRSALMGAGLVIAFLMLKSAHFRSLGYAGLLANALLLAGDLATGTSRAPLVAVLVGVGYLLLLAWFLVVGLQLLRLGSGRRSSPGI